MFKRYRGPVVVVVTVVYAIAAIVRPDLLLPEKEGFIAIIDAVFEALSTEGVPE